MEQNDDYYLRIVTVVLASKWALPVLYRLRGNTKRYHEINKALPDLKQKVLTDILHKLERLGFIRRDAHPTVPPRVDYSLTELGESFLASMAPVIDWTRIHLHEVRDAQATYDTRDSEN